MPDLLPPAHEAEAYRGKTIVVTGAGGFLGGRLVNRLAAVACEIIRVSRAALPQSDRTTVATVSDVIGDVRDTATWARVLDQADVVFHLAAQTSAVTASEDPALDFDLNVTPMRLLLRTCRQLRRRPVVLFAGTVTQAGVAPRLPVDEDTVDQPVTTYDRHKLMAEDELKAAAAEGTVRGGTLRLANVYGPGAHGRIGDRDVLNRVIRNAVRGQALTVYGAGEYLRDYLFVEDVVGAFLIGGAAADGVNGRHYVIGSGHAITIRAAFELVAARAERQTGRRVPVVTTEPATALSAIEQRHFVADSSRFAAATGWRPGWTLTDGIDRTIEACRCE